MAWQKQTAIASRDYGLYCADAIAEALDRIFGMGHNYDSGDIINDADEETCREIATEYIGDWGGYDDKDVADEAIDALTNTLIDAANKHLIIMNGRRGVAC